MKTKVLLGLVFVAVLSIGSYLAIAPQASGDFGPSFGSASAETAAEVDTSTISDMVLGDENAPITIIEYASFTCPHCRSFHEGAFKKLKADYIDTGEVRFTYREIYFDRFGLWSSIIARCGGQEKFFAISDMLFTKQAEWTKGSPAEVAEKLRRIGLTAGLSQDDVQACFSDSKKAQTLVAWFEEKSAADDITSTPSFMINGIKYANMPYDKFKEILEAQ
jgi:protein-disulfide isomerase